MTKKCIVCSSNKNIHLFKPNSFGGYPTYVCDKCGLYFFLGEDKKIEKKCNELYHRKYWSKIRKKIERKKYFINISVKILRILRTHPSQQAWHMKIIKKFNPKKRLKLLELGCGKGDTLKYFSKLGIDVKGIEPDLNSAKRLNKWFGKKVCINESGEKIKIIGKFDVIYLCHVFEHLVRPDLFIKKVKKNLNPDGIIFLEIPNCENKKILNTSIKNPHIYNFTYNSIKKLFENHNYDVLKVDTYAEKHKNYIIQFFVMLFKLSNYKKTPKIKGESIIIVAKNK
jgi:2-polyprenyl-3-methyl-5-hydroxy-6-metoxy-1,4-benzoquinol methylase